jgi:hypothetical protein
LQQDATSNSAEQPIALPKPVVDIGFFFSTESIGCERPFDQGDTFLTGITSVVVRTPVFPFVSLLAHALSLTH